MTGADDEILATRLEHRFSDPGLFRAALTHRSARGPHNERLEFLGDALLSFVVAEELFRRYPRVDEGDLSRLRAALVRQATLAGIARELDLGRHLRLGPGELKSGGFRRDSIIADALEAVLGAVYLDAGFDAARALVQRLYRDRWAELPALDALKDPKTRLQEWLQAQGRVLPAYRIVAVEGEGHNQLFTVECNVGTLVTRAAASSRRKAEQAAAHLALEQLQ